MSQARELKIVETQALGADLLIVARAASKGK